LAVVDTRGEGISGDYQKDHDLAFMGVVEGGLASLEDLLPWWLEALFIGLWRRFWRKLLLKFVLRRIPLYLGV
jgi:hypothetical protein